MKELLKSWQILLLVFFLAISIILIYPNPYAKGVVVKSISTDSPLYGKIAVGEKITWINEENIETTEDFYEFEKYSGVLRFMHDNKLGLADVSGYLGITVSNVEKTNLNFGMDLIGGTRVLLKIKENVSSEIIEQTIATLQTRINVYGLRESKFQSASSDSQNYILIEMAGGSKEEIEELLAKQGRFEARIPKIVKLENNKGVLLVGGKNYTVEKNEYVNVLGKSLRINDSFELDNIEFILINSTNSTIIFDSIAFTSKDIKSVCMQDQPGICRSFIRQTGKGYEFVFQVSISLEGAERFAKLTEDMNVVLDPKTGRYYLENGFIVLYLDEKLITQLSIDKGLKGKAETQPSITGFREEKDEALKEKLMLQSILQSGQLPVDLGLEKVDQISASLGKEFINSIIIAVLIGMVAVFAVVFIRYHNIKIGLPMILTSFSEVVMILGVASLIHWTIDLAAIAGMIAVIGMGIDAQIMIIDEMLLGRGRLYNLKQKIKRAFFIIFSSAATTSMAMLPLMFIGIGVMRGFAITTLIGIAVSVGVARPAFGKIAEKVIGG